MIIILKDESLLKKILSLMIEFEMYNSTILDGESIENVVAKKIPIFSDLNNMFGRESAYNRTIIAFSPDLKTVENFVRLCSQEGIDFEKPDIGCLLTVPCSMFIGEH